MADDPAEGPLITEPEVHDPSVDQGEIPEPRPGYDVVKSEREDAEDTFQAASHFHPTFKGEDAEGNPIEADPAAAEGQEYELPLHQAQKAASSQTKFYAIIGIGLGLFVGLCLAVYFLFPAPSNTFTDMGTVNANAWGLKGHMSAKWADKLDYQLTIEPSAPEQRAAFISAVTTSPRPLSIAVQLKDPFGVALCGNTILVKFDPRNVPVTTTEEPAPQPKGKRADKTAEETLQSREQVAQAINLAHLEGQELDREHGKDVFQQTNGTDGQAASLNAQGIMPCSKKQFDSTAAWSFTPDFPVVAPQYLHGNAGQNPNADQAAADEAEKLRQEADKLAALRRARRAQAQPISRYFIEGDDAIVWYDASSGIAETSAGKAFRIDKSNPALIALKGRDFPVQIHYRCDQMEVCTFTGVGLGVQRAKLSK